MRWGRLTAVNHRGLPIPIALGLMLIAGALLGGAVVAASEDVGTAGWIVAAGSLLVAAAGLIDDLNPGGPRGLRGHLRALASFHVTTGTVKLVLVSAVSLVVVAALPSRPLWVLLAGAVAISGCANLWNGLDVVPGRALKAFLPAAAVIWLAGPALALAPTLPGVVVAAALALPVDLRERAMLGDGGANLLGFTAGVGAYLISPGWGVVAIAVIAVALNVLADTVTLSRVIDAVAPLRWFDRLGRAAADPR
jgi:UDP-N-acetylmuramyl pentapeptide phosphotransferase/UDP-N-acetylglucosamine-1-phosphate transferase